MAASRPTPADADPGHDPGGTTVTGPSALRGELRVPGDKSISHRALLFSALAQGTTTITGLSGGEDVAATRRALETLGVPVGGGPEAWVVEGGHLREADDVLDHGNSGTGIRLMAGLVAGRESYTVLTGDPFLRSRPMDRILGPLREMGARCDGRGGGRYAPLTVRGGGLTAIEYRSPVASAQVKSAVLLAGLSAPGTTTVVEPTATRRHTEEMIEAFDGPVTVEGTRVSVRGPATLTSPGRVVVPGDPSQAAFWIVAGAVLPDSDLTVRDVYLGPGRAGFLPVLERMGARIEVDRTDATHGTVRARPARLHGVEITPDEVPDVIDEIPALAVAAAFAEGTTTVSGAGELRVKESDRIRTCVAMLQAFGVGVRETEDGFVVEGSPGGFAAGPRTVESAFDHRICMASAILALGADGPTAIRGWSSVATSYPGFSEQLETLRSAAT